jgi:chemosensory pili system protein ChpA (sensor histidine kinase/response regulator)
MPTAEQPPTTVLVVEDDDSTRGSVTTLLRRHRYTVAAVRNGAEALTWLSAGTAPAAVLLDMMMPALDGWGFLARLRAGPLGRAPIVVMTGADVSPAWAAANGCAGVLPKPFDEADLLAALCRVLGTG